MLVPGLLCLEHDELLSANERNLVLNSWRHVDPAREPEIVQSSIRHVSCRVRCM